MTNEVKIIAPPGMFGASIHDSVLETAMRVIGVAFADPHEWASKYGTDYENDVFVMRTQYWGDCTCGAMDTGPDEPERDCEPTCPTALPNFRHKASGFEVCWYKYIGRGMEFKGAPPSDLMQQVFASHPKGMTLEEAYFAFAKGEQESAEALRQMFESLSPPTNG